MRFTTTTSFSLLCYGLLSSAAPAMESRSDADSIPGYTDKHYYPTLDARHVGEHITTLKGLNWTGFTVQNARTDNTDGHAIQPSSQPNYAVAAAAQSSDVNSLPTLRVSDGGTLFKLNSFYWAATPYYSDNMQLSVLGYNLSTNGSLKCTRKSAEFVYNTGFNVGANGAQLQLATLPANFIFNTYKFNITAPSGADVPKLYLDDLKVVTYIPTK